MKVQNIKNANGRAVPNQFILTSTGGMRWFQSYESMIAMITASGQVSLDKTYWDYSKTTGKYRNQFLGESKKETQAKIDSGEYVLTDLN